MTSPRIPSAVVLGPIHELFDSLDRNQTTCASERQYRHQPSIAKLPDGTLIGAMRAAGGHSSTPDWTSLVRSYDGGVTWEDRRGETLVDAGNPAGVTHIAAISYVGDRLWLVGCDVQYATGIYPSRAGWVRFSLDLGATWSAKVMLPVLGTLHTTFGATAIFGDPFDASALYVAGYYRDFLTTPPYTQEKRYTASLLKSSDNGATWSLQGTIARDESPTQGRQFEEPLALFVGDVAGHLRAYIREDAGGEQGVNKETIYTVESFDHGQTWTLPDLAFPGRGTTSVIRTRGGVYVACTRSPGLSPSIGMRGVLWMSDDGTSWRPWSLVETPTVDLPDGEFQMPRTANGGLFDGGGYMGGVLIELAPDVIGILSTQETVASDAYSRCGLYWREGIVMPSQPVMPVRWRSEAAIEFPASSGNYLNYGRHPVLDGKSEWTIQLRQRFMGTGTATWCGSPATLLSSAAGSPVQRQVAICQGAGRSFEVWVATSLTAWAIFRTPLNHPACVNNAWVTVTVRFHGAALRVWLDDVEVTLEQTYGGALPAVMTTPTAALWQLGANAGANSLRQTQLADVAIWTTAIHAEDIPDLRKLGDKRQAPGYMGPPSVWLRCDSSPFLDTQTAWTAPTVTGSLSIARRSLCARSAEEVLP